MIRMRSMKMVAAGLAVASLALSGCAESERDDDRSGQGGGGTFVFAGSAEPVTLDPFFASDGESFRRPADLRGSGRHQARHGGPGTAARQGVGVSRRRPDLHLPPRRTA